METRHIQIPTHSLELSNKLLLDKILSSDEKILLAEIIWLQDNNTKYNKTDYCYASNYYFSFILNKKIRQIGRYVSSLHQKGYIEFLKYQKGDNRRIKYIPEKCIDDEDKRKKPLLED